MEALDDAGVVTQRPIEFVVWMNEEGSRFAPPTMGSAVCAGKLPLQDALAVTDGSGVSVGAALDAHRRHLPPLAARALGTKGRAYVAAHIE